MLKAEIVNKHINMYDTTEVLENKIGKKRCPELPDLYLCELEDSQPNPS